MGLIKCGLSSGLWAVQHIGPRGGGLKCGVSIVLFFLGYWAWPLPQTNYFCLQNSSIIYKQVVPKKLYIYKQVFIHLNISSISKYFLLYHSSYLKSYLSISYFVSSSLFSKDILNMVRYICNIFNKMNGY